MNGQLTNIIISSNSRRKEYVFLEIPIDWYAPFPYIILSEIESQKGFLTLSGGE
jgi:hypothetical protein